MKSSYELASLLVTIIVSLLLLFVPNSNAAITCATVIKDVGPCVNYLKNGSGAPPPGCCSGAKALAATASTTADRRAACACLKSASQRLNPNPELAQSLPGKCGINLGFTISSSVDCTKIT
ncbi:non-specific lipid-transfer protein 1-like [Rutidosis leptorrhynchoides]|uniref:non-specific lipid-transfer protein 1-like n=1 Tax=Rutidosis leptorrhynchoides TaxID=125765 RepID=UPI003A9965ED